MPASHVFARLVRSCFSILLFSSLLLSCATETPLVLPRAVPLVGYPLASDQYALEQINGVFPQSIFIKTRTQTFNSYYDYLVYKGKIWVKKREDVGRLTAWRLLKETGLPFSSKAGFIVPGAVAEIAADGDSLAALSDAGVMYRLTLDAKKTHDNAVWTDRQGAVGGGVLVLDSIVAQSRSWTTSKRGAEVMFYEDRFGTQHHYGLIGVVSDYFLLPNGQEIRYSDPGLPPDFSHTLLGPERGRFIAEGLAASASTLFLIGSAGEMYTRLADFDVVGSDPMLFKYTYKPVSSLFSGEDYRSNYVPWGLPAEDWVKQPPLPLDGMAVATKRITIVQNGKGNAARELRVAGRDREGNSGYWSKGILDSRWNFERAPLRIQEEDELRPVRYGGAQGPRGDSLDTRMEGFFWVNGVAVHGWSAVVENFNILEGRCDLTINRYDEKLRVVIHPVETWTFLKRKSPGRDRVPKSYYVTLEIPKNAFKGLSSQFKAEFLDMAGDKDLEAFKYVGEATDEYLLIEPREQNGFRFKLFLTKDGAVRDHPDFGRVQRLVGCDLLAGFRDSALTLHPAIEYRGSDMGEITLAIAANQELKEELQDRVAAIELMECQVADTKFAAAGLDALSNVSMLNQLGVVKNFNQETVALVRENERIVALMKNAQGRMDRTLLDIVDLRLRSYRVLLDRLEAGAESVKLPSYFSENYGGYWQMIKLPESLRGTLRYGGNQLEASITVLPLDSYYPGWQIGLNSKEYPAILAIPERFVPTVYDWARAGNVDGKLVFDASLFLAAPGTDQEITNAIFGKTSQRKARIIVDRARITIRVPNGLLGYVDVFTTSSSLSSASSVLP